MQRQIFGTIVATLLFPLATFAADMQVNLGNATSVSIAKPAGDLIPTTFNLPHGQSGWVVKVSKEALCTPGYGKGQIFLGGGFSSNAFYAFKASTGQKAWQVQTLDNGPTSPVEENGVVVYNTESCHIEALVASSGQRLWSEAIGMTLYTQPAVAGGKVFTTHPVSEATPNQGRRYKMMCLDLKTGQHYWDTDISCDVLAAPVVANGRVYFTCGDGQAYCLRQETGGMVWQEQYMGTAAPLVANASVVMPVQDNAGHEGLKRFDAQGGDEKDSVPLTSARVESIKLQKEVLVPWDYQGPRPVLAQGQIISAQDNTVTSLNVDTGKIDWRVTFHSFMRFGGGAMFTPLALGTGKVYLASTDGHVLCLNQADGTVLFNYATGQSFATQPILAEGNIYLTTTTGLLLCLKTGDPAADGWYGWGGNAAHNKQ